MVKRPLNGKLALEMAMQDVMDNMEELTLSFGFAGGETCFEILSIEPADIPDVAAPATDYPVFRSPFAAEVRILQTSQHVA